MTNSIRLQARIDLFILGFAALAVALVLFYEDEGNYTFNGIFWPDNLFFLLVYVTAFFGFELLVHKGFIKFIFRDKRRKTVSAVLAAMSLPLALIIFLWVIMAA